MADFVKFTNGEIVEHVKCGHKLVWTKDVPVCHHCKMAILFQQTPIGIEWNGKIYNGIPVLASRDGRRVLL